MVGVPVDFSLDAIKRFNEAGFKIVVVKQLEDVEASGLRKRNISGIYESCCINENIRKYEKKYTEFKEDEFVRIASEKARKTKQAKTHHQITMLENKFVSKLKVLNLEHMSSYDALKLLHEWKKEILKAND